VRVQLLGDQVVGATRWPPLVPACRRRRRADGGVCERIEV